MNQPLAISGQPSAKSQQQRNAELQKYSNMRVVFVGWNTAHAEILKKKVIDHVVEVAVKKKTDAAKAKAKKATA